MNRLHIHMPLYSQDRNEMKSWVDTILCHIDTPPASLSVYAESLEELIHVVEMLEEKFSDKTCIQGFLLKTANELIRLRKVDLHRTAEIAVKEKGNENYLPVTLKTLREALNSNNSDQQEKRMLSPCDDIELFILKSGDLVPCMHENDICYGNLLFESLCTVLHKNKIYIPLVQLFCSKNQAERCVDNCRQKFGTKIIHYPKEFELIQYGDPLVSKYVEMRVRGMNCSNQPTRVVTVTGDSMTPTFCNGEQVTVNMQFDRTKPISVGTVVVYYKVSDHITVHRVIFCGYLKEYDMYYYRTKGDGNDFPDPYFLSIKNIIGIVDG